MATVQQNNVPSVAKGLKVENKVFVSYVVLKIQSEDMSKKHE